MRNYSLIDKLCITANNFLNTVLPNKNICSTNYPKSNNKMPLNQKEKKLSANLMRVNHCGEVCAQALYRGQAFLDSHLQDKFLQLAAEEYDHLLWCQQRLKELDSHISYLSPFFYLASFLLGITVSCFDDSINAGFIEATESQVTQHLINYQQRLPKNDHQSWQVIEQMKLDEIQHQQTAVALGAVILSKKIQKLMSINAKIMIYMTFYL